MSLRNFTVVAVVLVVASVCGCSHMVAHERALVNQHLDSSLAQNGDPITGEWNVTFYVHEMKTPATFEFKLDGNNLTGTAYSEHTGPGTIRDGKWSDGKLSFTLDFAKHESIVVKGALTEGKLVGEFSTEGFTDKWEAVKR